MKVEIWSDIACPWCYIGKRRFEKALEFFPHAGEVEVIWRSYQLDPEAPQVTSTPIKQMLMEEKGASEDMAEQMIEQVTQVAAQEGLDYRMELGTHGNTFDAHRLVHLAARHGKAGEMKERLFRAYFTDGLAIGDTDALRRCAAEVGLPQDEVERVLSSDEFGEEVYADLERGLMSGLRGVPHFVFDEKYALSGAQDPEIFALALRQAWKEKE